MKAFLVVLVLVGIIAGLFVYLGTKQSSRHEQENVPSKEVNYQPPAPATGWSKFTKSVNELQASLAKFGDSIAAVKDSPEAKAVESSADATVKDFKTALSQISTDLEKKWNSLGDDGRKKAEETLEDIKKETAKIHESTVKAFKDLEKGASEQANKAKVEIDKGIAELQKLTQKVKEIPQN